MISSINGKPRDRVASYAGSMLNKVNSGGPSSQANQKKKPYRARGCRGGASRKGRKKQPISHSNQNEENDPSRLNNNSEKRSYNVQAPDEGSPLKFVDTSDQIDAKSDSARFNTQVSSQDRAHSLSILPTGSELNLHQGTSGHITESTIEVKLVDQSQQCDGSTSNRKCKPKPILSDVLHESATQSTNRGACAPSAKAWPASASSTAKTPRDENSGGGFSFFCISPRSFLSGRTTKTQKLH